MLDGTRIIADGVRAPNDSGYDDDQQKLRGEHAWKLKALENTNGGCEREAEQRGNRGRHE